MENKVHMKRLAIVGSGDLGQLIAYHASSDGHYQISGFFDDFQSIDAYINGYPILGGIKDIFKKYQERAFDEIIIGIGYKHLLMRKNIFELCFNNIPIGKIVHSSAFVDSSCSVGDGSFVLPGCVLDRNVIIESNVLLNTGCVIAHDSKICKHTFLSPCVSVAGFVQIEESCNIGINTTIIDNVIIRSNIQTGGGAVVIKSLERPGLYVGNPARFVR
jgi:sugar O-acyltransferase (sialic acid O-acetyltransferase NeuD family)